MTYRDRGIVAALGVVLVALAIAIALPGTPAEAGPTPPPSAALASPSSAPSTAPTAVYREGVIGRPSSINPLTARTQADRDLAALVFSGLVAVGPDGTYRPDLASGWQMDPKGKVWTFTIRPDAHWQDGVPVTSDDVVFTIAVLQDPDYSGPLAASWRGVSVTAVSQRTVSFTLTNPIGGFLQAATIGLLPAHLLADAPIATLADDPFSLQPVGSGPFVLESWNAETATLVPASLANAPAGEPDASASPSPDGSIDPGASAAATAGAASASPAPSALPSASPTGTSSSEPELPGIELHFYPDAQALAAAYRAGEIDVATGLPPDLATGLAALPASRLLRYPRTTVTAIALNLRPGNGELRVPALRHGLLAAIDRKGLIADVFAGLAVRADSPIPPSSWAFDPKASRQVRYDVKRAAADLKAAGWKRLAGGWAAPGTRKPYVMELISPDAATNPTAMAVAQAVAADWRAFGLQTKVTGLPPAKFVDDRLKTGTFQAAAVDVTIGLDPDLYPLFGSTQVAKGSNITGIQDVALDRSLIKARAPGSQSARKAAFSRLQLLLAERNYLLPIAFRDELVVLSDRVQGPVVHELGDPSDRYWDVLTWRLADGG